MSCRAWHQAATGRCMTAPAPAKTTARSPAPPAVATSPPRSPASGPHWMKALLDARVPAPWARPRPPSTPGHQPCRQRPGAARWIAQRTLLGLGRHVEPTDLPWPSFAVFSGACRRADRWPVRSLRSGRPADSRGACWVRRACWTLQACSPAYRTYRNRRVCQAYQVCQVCQVCRACGGCQWRATRFRGMLRPRPREAVGLRRLLFRVVRRGGHEMRSCPLPDDLLYLAGLALLTFACPFGMLPPNTTRRRGLQDGHITC